MRILTGFFSLALSLGSLSASAVFALDAQQPIASDLDPKEYRAFVLENGMKVLLVSDAEADRAGASMDVHVGSASDPSGWNGLAHFLEHMLFLGTEKYPEAGDYQAFIKDHGGSHNAYTAYDHTNYFFNVNHDSLEGALDRFSRFFIDPTFEAKYVERERAVVHSEYQARLKDEGRRIWETQKQILNPGHPASRFTVGSNETLQDRDGVSVRDRLIDFYEQWYSADIMALAVVGRESLDTLETWVRDRFAQVPDRDVEVPVYIQSYLNRDLAPVRLDIVPEKQVNQVAFQWEIPTVYEEYFSKPVSYIANLLGHEGEGSLLAALKQRGWAESLSAGIGFMDRHQGTLMINIGLTEPGLDHIREIGEMLFRKIHLVREQGVEQWRFDEQSQLGEIAFQFAEESSASALARSLAARMHDYPFEDVLRGPYIMQEFDAARIEEILGRLVPEKVYMQVVSQQHKVRNISPWYDVRFGVSPIDPAWIASWQSAANAEPVELALPGANPYIPQRLSLVEDTVGSDKPELLAEVAPIQAWFQTDQEFRSPKANFFVSVKSEQANASARHSVLTDLLVRLLNDQLNPVSYPAQLAGLSYSLYRHSRGFSMRITGFEDKQAELLAVILGAIQDPAVTPEKLQLVKEELTRELQNQKRNRPSNQTVHEIYRLVMNPYWTEDERLEVISDITVEEVLDHAAKLSGDIALTTLAHGDLDKSAALALNRQVSDAFPEAMLGDTVNRPRIRRLESAQSYLRSMDIDHGDTALTYYFQGGEKSVEGRAYTRLLGQLIESPFYYDLRTSNRVGYLVFASSMNLMEVPGMLLSVQSPTHTATELDTLIRAFLAGFPTTVADMSEEEFTKVRSGLVASILSRDTNLLDRTGRYWTEIDLEETEFDTRQQLADAVEQLSKADILAFVEQIFSAEPRLVVVESAGRREGAGEGALSLADAIETGKPEDFRRSARSFFPAL